MIVKKMTATFGGLDRAALEPAPGLTVIHAPNEGGKSTWAGFLRAMLYGIRTRERDKEGHLAEKNRYAPWSGAPMEGELRLIWRGEEIVLRRFSARGTPFGGFEAVYAATGDPVPGLTAAGAGELLIGAGREMYERTAFLGQGGAGIGGSAELERRVAALAAAGEEGVSFTEAQRTLKDWLNRRRANRANGLLPRLDGELEETRAAIAALESARQESESARRRLEELEEERRELAGDLDIHRRIRQQELDRRYGQAEHDWQVAEAAVPRPEEHPIFGSMTGEEAWDFAQAKIAEHDAAEREARAVEQERAALEARTNALGRQMALWAVLTALALIAGGAAAVLREWFALFLLGIGAISCLFNILRVRALRRRVLEDLEGLAPVPIPDPGDILEQAAAYRAALTAAGRARAAADAAKRLMEELAAQGGRPYTTLEFLHPPERPMAETMAQLKRVEEELAYARRSLDKAQGRLDALGDLDALYSRLDELTAMRAERQREFDAIAAAMEALEGANDALRRRFSPALNRRAGELFARLTGGRYAALSLTRAFEGSATPAGEVLPRSALALSAGTAEQLYLAARLALCQLTLGGEDPPPIVLDDALASFDDGRMELALELLRELGEERQILLFTCHRREAAWAEERGVPVRRS